MKPKLTAIKWCRLFKSHAEEIDKKAYWNSIYFDGTADDLKTNGLWQQKKSK